MPELNRWVVTCFWIAVGGYGLAIVLMAWGALLKRPRLLEWGLYVTASFWAVHTVSVALRWVAAGRPPVIQGYENALVGAWAIVGAFLILAWRYPRLRAAGSIVVPFAVLTLGYGATISPAIPEYLPAYRSGWLVVHVVFAWMSYATYSVAAGVALAEILKTRAQHKGTLQPDGTLARLPSMTEIQDITLRLVAFGFIVNAVMIVSGAIWAYRLWGSYWAWDPVENWSLITWLAYGLYLHLRLTLGWRGPKLAWVAVAALLGVFMTFWGIQMFPTTYHLFQRMGAGRIQGFQ